MKSIITVHELHIPDKHKRFITGFLNQARYIPTFSQITDFILFGSCARGDATDVSDVDIMAIGNGIGDDTLFDLYDCAFYPGWDEKENLINNDIMVNDKKHFEIHLHNVGSLQWRINKDGVILKCL